MEKKGGSSRAKQTQTLNMLQLVWDQGVGRGVVNGRVWLSALPLSELLAGKRLNGVLGLHPPLLLAGSVACLLRGSQNVNLAVFWGQQSQKVCGLRRIKGLSVNRPLWIGFERLFSQCSSVSHLEERKERRGERGERGERRERQMKSKITSTKRPWRHLQ